LQINYPNMSNSENYSNLPVFGKLVVQFVGLILRDIDNGVQPEAAVNNALKDFEAAVRYVAEKTLEARNTQPGQSKKQKSTAKTKKLQIEDAIQIA